jgi:DNA-binding GntR family transcriptional regulator
MRARESTAGSGMAKGQQISTSPDSQLFTLGPHRTVEQVVVAKLREAIITGSLKPGDRLAYRDLAHRFGVSVTPVRIALRELSNEGLVEMRAHTGARVSPLSIDEIEEIFATRIGIEGWLARHGAERLTDQDVRELAGYLDELRRAEQADDLESYLRASWSMRAVCYRVAEKPRLFDRFRALYEHSTRYVYWLMAEPSRLEQSRRNMERFFAACEARDGLAAQEAIQHALLTTLSYLSEAFGKTPSATGLTD